MAYLGRDQRSHCKFSLSLFCPQQQAPHVPHLSPTVPSARVYVYIPTNLASGGEKLTVKELGSDQDQ